MQARMTIWNEAQEKHHLYIPPLDNKKWKPTKAKSSRIRHVPIEQYLQEKKREVNYNV